MHETVDENKLDFAAVFPSKGDDRRPPEWLGRALLYTVIAVFLAIFVWISWSKISFLVLDLIIALFIALAMEPLVARLVHHGWKRGIATFVVLISLMIISIVLLVLFGNLFVHQVISMAYSMPSVYQEIATYVQASFDFKLPELTTVFNEIASNIRTSALTNLAGQALSTTFGFFGAVINMLTVLMVTYYISAAGSKMRRSICHWLGPSAQRRFLLVWTIVQGQISGFLFSRTILAVLNAAFTAVFLVAINVPYWLPLSLFCGLTSQFVPTVGTYLGGALPILFAWGSNGATSAIMVLVFICIYQQIENLVFSPAISQRTMDLNPALAFISVLFFGAIFGALGAFLALPITSSLQVIFKAYTKQYPLVDSPLMLDEKPIKKSKVVAGAEAFSRHVVKPVSQRIPRSARGSSARVQLNKEIRQLHEEIYGPGALDYLAYDRDDYDAGSAGFDGETIALVQNNAHKRNQSVTSVEESVTSVEEKAGSTSSGVDETGLSEVGDASNPRSQWK